MVSYGNSLIVDPRGITVQRAGESREELLFHDVDFTHGGPRWVTRDARAAEIHHALHR